MTKTALGSLPLILLLSLAPGPGGAQEPAGSLRIPLRSTPLSLSHPHGTVLGWSGDVSRRGLGAVAVQEAGGAGPGPATSFLSSLLLPGSAQWMRGQSRSYVYVGLEVLGWIGFLHQRDQGADYRDGYHDLARTYALLGGDSLEPPGGFGYYETLGQWGASGAWDLDPATDGLQPETDPETYNGNIWSLATDLYLSGEGRTEDPDALRMALLYYQERAYPPEQGWDWQGNSVQMSRYRDLIEKSDESFRRSTVILGAVVANHLLSAVDGFLSSRLSSDSSLRFSSSVRTGRAFSALDGSHGDLLWSFHLRVNAIP